MRLPGRQVAVGFGLGVGIGGVGCYIYYSKLKPEPSPKLTGPDIKHEALKFGMPVTESLQVHDGFVTAFDFRTRNPKWVLEIITPEGLQGVQKDFKSSQQAMDQTFTLSNISPQVGQGFNRDYWARFESFIRGVARRCREVRVVTGPLWLPTMDAEGKWCMRYNLIGMAPSLVSVPTHFYKVITAHGCKTAAANGDNRTGVAAFVMPNAPIDPKTPLSAFVVPLEALEAAAGTRFFPELVSSGGRRALDDAAHSVRYLGLQQMKPFERIALQQSMLPAPAQAQTTILSASSAASKQAKEAIRSPSSGAADAGGVGSSTQGANEQLPAIPLPRTAGLRVVHLCEVESCRLPVERFWESNGNNGGGNNDHGHRSRRSSSDGSSGGGSSRSGSSIRR